MKKPYLCCALFLLLAACGGHTLPAYVGTVYTPPDTPGGRLCIDQCAKARDYCKQSCDLDYRACYNGVLASAEHDYDKYARERYGNSLPLTMLPSDFEHPEACDSTKKSCDSDCTEPYNSCYRSCGGAVSVATSCQFFCFE